MSGLDLDHDRARCGLVGTAIEEIHSDWLEAVLCHVLIMRFLG